MIYIPSGSGRRNPKKGAKKAAKKAAKKRSAKKGAKKGSRSAAQKAAFKKMRAALAASRKGGAKKSAKKAAKRSAKKSAKKAAKRSAKKGGAKRAKRAGKRRMRRGPKAGFAVKGRMQISRVTLKNKKTGKRRKVKKWAVVVSSARNNPRVTKKQRAHAKKAMASASAAVKVVTKAAAHSTGATKAMGKASAAGIGALKEGLTSLAGRVDKVENRVASVELVANSSSERIRFLRGAIATMPGGGAAMKGIGAGMRAGHVAVKSAARTAAEKARKQQKELDDLLAMGERRGRVGTYN